MKKALIVILLIMTVFCSAVFADNGFDNYSGISFGFGFSKSRIEDLINVRSNELIISFTDFGFFEKSPVGIFLDGSLVITTKCVEYTEHTEYDVPAEDLPAGLMATIGPAFKFDMGKSVDLILGVGFQVYNQQRVNPYDKWDQTFFGVGLDIEAAYELGKHFSISFGVDGSFYFANVRKHILWNKTVDVSYDKYWEYRVIPKISGYYVY